MTLLPPERERPDFLRPVAPPARRRHAGQFALMARGPAFPMLRTWKADRWQERHPRLHALAVAIFFAGVGFALVVLAWRPWE